MKTLLATDGSDHAQTAMTTAARLLVHRDNHFDTLCVVPELHPALRSGGRNFEARIRAEAGKRLETACQSLRREGVRAGQIVETGSPADTILRVAGDYDLVVAGVRHQSERAGPGLGPVASRILERSDLTVLIGRTLQNEKSFRILAPVDGSSASANAIEMLRSGFRLTDADITLMHVIEKPWLRLDLAEEWGGGVDPRADAAEESELQDLFEGELHTEAEGIIETARSSLAGGSAGTEALIVEGDPGPEILRQAEVGEYDLVILGATGATDLKHALLGSVSFRLASNAPCSVAVVR
jgi:nucleotide-binding universal stress UspA family protein